MSSFTSTPDNTSIAWNFTSNTNITVEQGPPMDPEQYLLLILKTYPDYMNSLKLGRYGCSLQVTLGTVTNLLTIAVMTRRSMITSTTCFYFAILAMADLFVLYFTCLRRLLYVVNDQTEVYIDSSWSCRIFNFLAYFSFDFSSWILTVMTIDRFIAIRYPLKAAIIGTIRNAAIIVIAITILCVAKNLHFFFTFEKTSRDGCLGKDAYTDFLDEVWPWIDATFYSFLPFSLLFVFNLLIIYHHHKALRSTRSLHASNGVFSRVTHGARITTFSQRLTTMLLTVSITFMMMTAPKVILIIIRQEYFVFFSPAGNIDFAAIARYSLVSAIFNFLMWTNHSINFFLYCLSGKRFRQEFVRMLVQWQLCLRCKHRAKVFTSNQPKAQRQTINQRHGASNERRGSNSSVISDDAPPVPAQLSVETVDAMSRVNRWATVTFGEAQSKQEN